MSEEIDGTVERVLFQNAENGFVVLRVRLVPASTTAIVVGNFPAIAEGERIVASGVWRDDRKFGRQFAADSIVPRRAEGRAQVEAFLGSGAIRGIGPATASLMWVQFKDRIFDVLDNEPQRLREIPGIGKVRAKIISDSWKEQRSMRDLMLFLADSGIGAARAARIQKQFGANAVEIIRQNPYRLAREVRGVGFVTADALALKLGIARDSMERIRAGVGYALAQAALDGHCGLPEEELIKRAADLLGIARDNISDAIALEVGAHRLIRDTIGGEPAVFIPAVYEDEREIGQALRALAATKPAYPAIAADRALKWAEKQTGVALAASQKTAIELVLRSSVCVITGGPGTGKTTLVNAILRILRAKEVEVLLAAPTGRAAKRLAESTGSEAKTIHRLLEVNAMDGAFARNADNPLECDLLIVDEASMIDVALMAALIDALPLDAALLLVGDVDQLPAVGAGHVLGDIIASEALPTVRLTEIFRQAAQSRIVVAAHEINEGRVPDLAPNDDADFFFVRSSPDRTVERIVSLVTDRIPKRFGLDPMRDVQVLAPMRRSTAGVETLNAALQAALNPAAIRAESPRIERMGTSFHAGDKVMQTVNDYDKDVFNGDIGIIRSIDAENGTAFIDFEGRRIEYEEEDFENLVLSYATTIHKSQGSEYPAVVIALSTQHAIMLQRNLIYTAVTRGRKLVVVVGQEQALERAVAAKNVRRRWTKLREWLVGDAPKAQPRHGTA